MKKPISLLILLLLAIILIGISGCKSKEIMTAKQIPLEDFFKNPEKRVISSHLMENIMPLRLHTCAV